MPETEVRFYRDEKGNVPIVDWLASLPAKARDRCLAALLLLEREGHGLRRPTAENLGGGSMGCG